MTQGLLSREQIADRLLEGFVTLTLMNEIC